MGDKNEMCLGDPVEKPLWALRDLTQHTREQEGPTAASVGCVGEHEERRGEGTSRPAHESTDSLNLGLQTCLSVLSYVTEGWGLPRTDIPIG